MQKDSMLIQKAKKFAKKEYGDQKRLSGDKLFNHVDRVAKSLMENEIDCEYTVVGAYLHHIFRDTDVSEEVIKTEFGTEVFELLQNYDEISLSEFKDLEPSEKNEKLIFQTFLNLVEDKRVLVLRILDKTDNSFSLHALDNETGDKVAKKGLYFYAPLARLVNLNNAAKIIENNAFKIIHPESYFAVNSKIKELTPLIEKFFEVTIPTAYDLLKENGLEVEIQTRVKHEYGVFRKMMYLYQQGSDDITEKFGASLDLVGVRVIVESENDCYKAEQILLQCWKDLPERRNDFIAQPRKTGYRGIHDIFISRYFPFEVQITTKDMYTYNEFGPASHAVYKLTDKDKSNKKALKYINAMLEDNPFWMNDIKYTNLITGLSEDLNPFSNQIYVFSPKGDIIELPKGSNLIDYAYNIHSDLGNTCIGGWVNGEYQKLTYELQTGERVRVRVDKRRKKPKRDWLDTVKSYKAKKEIRKALAI